MDSLWIACGHLEDSPPTARRQSMGVPRTDVHVQPADSPQAGGGQSTDSPWVVCSLDRYGQRAKFSTPAIGTLDLPRTAHGQPPDSPCASHRKPVNSPSTIHRQFADDPQASRGQPMVSAREQLMESPREAHGQPSGSLRHRAISRRRCQHYLFYVCMYVHSHFAHVRYIFPSI